MLAHIGIDLNEKITNTMGELNYSLYFANTAKSIIIC